MKSDKSDNSTGTGIVSKRTLQKKRNMCHYIQT